MISITMLLYYVISCVIAALLLCTVSVSLFVWYKRPAWILQLSIWMSLRRCGLRTRCVRGKILAYCYAERGCVRHDQSTVVFVHGFSASKDSWVPIIQYLPEDQHIVAVDLPGHGDSSIPSSADAVSIHTMTECLKEMLTAAKLNSRPIHLIGTSMGGAIAGLYASRYPGDVERLTVICPAVITPVKSRFMLEYKQGTNRLLPATADEMKQMFSVAMYHKERAPCNPQILKAVLQLRQHRVEFLEKLFNSIAVKADLEKEAEVDRNFSNVFTPTQIVWGENDEMVDVSGAEKLRQLLPDCRRVDIVAECGHTVVWDQPKRVAELLQLFRRQELRATA